jgi:hypothetical protein
MKYIHKFSSVLFCEVDVLDRSPLPGEQHILKVLWSNTPKPKHIPEYIRWMHLVSDQYAKKFSARIMHVFQLSNSTDDWQFWTYSPDQPPKRLRFPIPSMDSDSANHLMKDFGNMIEHFKGRQKL